MIFGWLGWARALLSGNGMLALIVAGLAAYVINNGIQRNIGDKRAVERIKRDTEAEAHARDKRIRKARDSRPESGAAARLRKKYGIGVAGK